jgi:hypothetical protein
MLHKHCMHFPQRLIAYDHNKKSRTCSQTSLRWIKGNLSVEPPHLPQMRPGVMTEFPTYYRLLWWSSFSSTGSRKSQKVWLFWASRLAFHRNSCRLRAKSPCLVKRVQIMKNFWAIECSGSRCLYKHITLAWEEHKGSSKKAGFSPKASQPLIIKKNQRKPQGRGHPCFGKSLLYSWTRPLFLVPPVIFDCLQTCLNKENILEASTEQSDICSLWIWLSGPSPEYPDEI